MDLSGIQAFVDELNKMYAFPAYKRWSWARYDPVAYVWLCRAERRGAKVPWS